MNNKTRGLFLFPVLVTFAVFLGACHVDTPKQAQQTVDKLKARGGIDIRDLDGSTALIDSAENGHYYTVKLLLENGADVNASDTSGTTALLAILAINFGSPSFDESSAEFRRLSPFVRQEVKTVKVLVENHASLSVQDKNGRTPLMAAAVAKNAAAVDYLIKKGAEVNQANRDGLTVLGVLDGVLKKLIDTAVKDNPSAGTYDPNQALTTPVLDTVKQQYQTDYGDVIGVIKSAGGR